MLWTALSVLEWSRPRVRSLPSSERECKGSARLNLREQQHPNAIGRRDAVGVVATQSPLVAVESAAKEGLGWAEIALFLQPRAEVGNRGQCVLVVGS